MLGLKACATSLRGFDFKFVVVVSVIIICVCEHVCVYVCACLPGKVRMWTLEGNCVNQFSASIIGSRD